MQAEQQATSKQHSHIPKASRTALEPRCGGSAPARRAVMCRGPESCNEATEANSTNSTKHGIRPITPKSSIGAKRYGRHTDRRFKYEWNKNYGSPRNSDHNSVAGVTSHGSWRFLCPRCYKLILEWDMSPKSWDNLEDIAIDHHRKFPRHRSLTVRLRMHKWITELPGFSAIPGFNEAKLEAIQMAWHEEFQETSGLATSSANPGARPDKNLA